jgi:ethanolamine utilization protein EutP (predicted NTPase)
MDVGYEARDITKISGIPKATVYRIVDKLRTEAKHNFKELMEKDYLYKYQQNLEQLNKTIIECNEEIVKVHSKYDELDVTTQEALDVVETNKHISKAHLISNLISCRSSRTTEITKLMQERDRASEAKAMLYNKGPVVYRINEFVQNKLQNIPPMLNEGIKVEQAPMNVPEIEKHAETIIHEITPDDQAILDEMENDLDFNTSESNDGT